jgi:hypothetical protein
MKKVTVLYLSNLAWTNNNNYAFPPYNGREIKNYGVEECNQK